MSEPELNGGEAPVSEGPTEVKATDGSVTAEGAGETSAPPNEAANVFSASSTEAKGEFPSGSAETAGGFSARPAHKPAAASAVSADSAGSADSALTAGSTSPAEPCSPATSASPAVSCSSANYASSPDAFPDKPDLYRRAMALFEGFLYFLLFLAVKYVFIFVAESVLIGRYRSLAGSVDELRSLVSDAYARHYQVYALMIPCILLLAYALIFKLKRSDAQTELSVYAVPWKTGAASVLAGCVGCFAVTTALELLPLPEDVAASYGHTMTVITSGFLPLVLINSVLLAPILEEAVFRGLLQSRLRRAVPPWLAVLLSAAVFGLIHGNLIQSVYAFLLGLVLGRLFEISGSLIPPILFHIAFNGSTYLWALLPLPDLMPLRWVAVAVALLICFFLSTKKIIKRGTV